MKCFKQNNNYLIKIFRISSYFVKIFRISSYLVKVFRISSYLVEVSSDYLRILESRRTIYANSSVSSRGGPLRILIK